MIYTKTILPIYKLSTAKVSIFFDIYKFFLKKTERTFENKVVPLPQNFGIIIVSTILNNYENYFEPH